MGCKEKAEPFAGSSAPKGIRCLPLAGPATVNGRGAAKNRRPGRPPLYRKPCAGRRAAAPSSCNSRMFSRTRLLAGGIRLFSCLGGPSLRSSFPVRSASRTARGIWSHRPPCRQAPAPGMSAGDTVPAAPPDGPAQDPPAARQRKRPRDPKQDLAHRLPSAYKSGGADRPRRRCRQEFWKIRPAGAGGQRESRCLVSKIPAITEHFDGQHSRGGDRRGDAGNFKFKRLVHCVSTSLGLRESFLHDQDSSVLFAVCCTFVCKI